MPPFAQCVSRRTVTSRASQHPDTCFHIQKAEPMTTEKKRLDLIKEIEAAIYEIRMAVGHERLDNAEGLAERMIWDAWASDTISESEFKTYSGQISDAQR